MHVVQGRVAVDDLDRLSDLDDRAGKIEVGRDEVREGKLMALASLGLRTWHEALEFLYGLRQKLDD